MVDALLGPGKGGPHGPYFQSQRLDLYHSYAKKLLDVMYILSIFRARCLTVAACRTVRSRLQMFLHTRSPLPYTGTACSFWVK